MHAAASSILRVNASEPCEDRLQALLVLDARARVLVLDDEVRLRDVERQQLARRELVIEPVDGTVLDDLLTSELYSFCQSSSSPPAGFLKGVIMLFPMYPSSPIQFLGLIVSSTPDSSRQ